MQITRDMTEKRNAQEALHNISQHYQLLMSSVKDYGIVFVDMNGVIKQWNSGAKKLTEWSQDLVVGKHISILFPKESQQLADQQLKACMALVLSLFISHFVVRLRSKILHSKRKTGGSRNQETRFGPKPPSVS